MTSYKKFLSASTALATGFLVSSTGLLLQAEASKAHVNHTHKPVQDQLHLSHLDSAAPLIRLSLPKSGSSKRFSGKLQFVNNTKYQIKLSLVRTIRLSNSRLPQRLSLAPGATKTIPLSGSIQAREGFASVGVVYSSSMGGQSIGVVNIEIKNGRFRPIKTGAFGLGSKGSAAIAVPSSARIGPGIRGYKRFLKGTRSFGKTSKAMKGKRQTPQPKRTNQDNQFKLDSLKPKNQFRLINWLPNVWDPSKLISYAFDKYFSILTPNAVAANGVYKGRFVFRTTESSDIYLPAVGVGVKAVKGNQSCHHTPALARTTADGNGDFQLNINTGGSYKICYYTKNPFIKIGRKVNSDLYVWGDSARNSIPNSRVVRQPVRHDGVFDIWYEAMAFQTSMTNAGIDPVRTGNNRIRVKFPSAGGDCPPLPGPWSCAYSNGRVMMMADHALRHGVMSHELAHQVDNKYHQPRPAGSGGSHSFDGCYSPAARAGMVVTEGWANFEMARSLGTRSSSRFRNSYRPDIANQLIDSINMDLNGSNCAGVAGSGVNGSESNISTILWDFYDKSNDNNDTLHYVDPNYLTNMYLSLNPDTAKILNTRILNDCKSNANKNVTNNGQVCKGIFAQNGGSD
tara:strand:- start:222 stop:2093 length:1872 start_codon:yes stop_codon:yes gene_type:complete